MGSTGRGRLMGNPPTGGLAEIMISPVEESSSQAQVNLTVSPQATSLGFASSVILSCLHASNEVVAINSSIRFFGIIISFLGGVRNSNFGVKPYI